MSDKPEVVPVDLLTEIDIQLSLEIGCTSDKACLRRCKARIAELESAIFQYMQTTDQRGSKEVLLRNFLGMYAALQEEG